MTMDLCFLDSCSCDLHVGFTCFRSVISMLLLSLLCLDSVISWLSGSSRIYNVACIILIF